MINKSTLLLQVELEGPLRIGPLLIDTKLAFDVSHCPSSSPSYGANNGRTTSACRIS